MTREEQRMKLFCDVYTKKLDHGESDIECRIGASIAVHEFDKQFPKTKD